MLSSAVRRRVDANRNQWRTGKDICKMNRSRAERRFLPGVRSSCGKPEWPGGYGGRALQRQRTHGSFDAATGHGHRTWRAGRPRQAARVIDRNSSWVTPVVATKR